MCHLRGVPVVHISIATNYLLVGWQRCCLIVVDVVEIVTTDEVTTNIVFTVLTEAVYREVELVTDRILSFGVVF